MLAKVMKIVRSDLSFGGLGDFAHHLSVRHTSPEHETGDGPLADASLIGERLLGHSFGT